MIRPLLVTGSSAHLFNSILYKISVCSFTSLKQNVPPSHNMLSALNWQPTHTDGRNCQSHPTVIVSNWPSLREQPEATFDTSWPPQTRQIPQHRDYCETRPCDPACFAVDIIQMSHWLPTMLSIKQGWFAFNDIHITVNPDNTYIHGVTHKCNHFL